MPFVYFSFHHFIHPVQFDTNIQTLDKSGGLEVRLSESVMEKRKLFTFLQQHAQKKSN